MEIAYRVAKFLRDNPGEHRRVEVANEVGISSVKLASMMNWIGGHYPQIAEDKGMLIWNPEIGGYSETGRH